MRPSDLIGTRTKLESWPIMDVKPLERMRNGRSVQEVQEINIVIRPNNASTRVDKFRSPRSTHLSISGKADSETGSRIASLEEENKRLQANLDRAIKINEKMWSGVVDLRLAESVANGNSR